MVVYIGTIAKRIWNLWIVLMLHGEENLVMCLNQRYWDEMIFAFMKFLTVKCSSWMKSEWNNGDGKDETSPTYQLWRWEEAEPRNEDGVYKLGVIGIKEMVTPFCNFKKPNSAHNLNEQEIDSLQEPRYERPSRYGDFNSIKLLPDVMSTELWDYKSVIWELSVLRALRGHQKASDLLELELQGVVNCQM